MASNEAKVVSINKLKSNSFKLALAVKRSRNESNGESFSLEEYAGMPVGEIEKQKQLNLMIINYRKIYIKFFTHLTT